MTNIAAVDIGGTNTKIAIVNQKAEILITKSFPTEAHLPIKNFMKILKELLMEFHALYKFEGVGIGSPNYNPVTKLLDSPPNLSWGTIPLEKFFHENLPWPCILEKDANLAALGELHFGLGKNFENFIFVTLGTGIGTGVVLNKRLWRGTHGLAGEGGHLVVGDQKRVCGCGGLDHLEAYSSVTAIRKFAQEVYGRETSFTEVLENFSKNQDKANEIFNNAAVYLARGIVNMTSLIAPDAVILGGGGMAAGDKFLKLVLDNMKQHQFVWHQKIPVLKTGLALNESSLLGAAGLFF